MWLFTWFPYYECADDKEFLVCHNFQTLMVLSSETVLAVKKCRLPVP